MATPGLSLVGFMGETRGVDYLGKNCILADPSPSALLAKWREANAKLGDPFAVDNAPNDPIPDGHDDHVEEFKRLPWMAEAFQLYSVDVRLVKADELLAFQFSIDLQRSDSLCADLPSAPALANILPKCLPIEPLRSPPIAMSGTEQFLIVKSASPDLRIVARGPIPGQLNFIGIQVGWALPAVN